MNFRPLNNNVKSKVYFTLGNESLNNFYALITVLKHISKKSNTHKIGLAFNSPLLIALGKNIPWLDLPTVSTLSVDSSIPLCLIAPSQEKVTEWEKTDRETDFQLQKLKFSHIDEERLRVDEFKYSEPISIMRDVLDIFDVYPGERPTDIFNLGKAIAFIDSKQMYQAGWDILLKNNIKSGAFSLVEIGYADWNGTDVTPSIWGRVIKLPSEKELMSLPVHEALGYINLMTHRDCAVLGIRSYGYILPSVSAYSVNKNVIWDLRTDNFDEKTQLLGHHVPLSIKIIAPMGPVDDNKMRLELVYSLGNYHSVNKPLICNNKGMQSISRPIIDNEFVYSWA